MESGGAAPVLSMPDQFPPSIWDRLLAAEGEHRPGGLVGIDKIKAQVARDVENILNARQALFLAGAQYSLAARSVIGFGLTDFAHVTTYGTHEMEEVCRSIERAILAHEHRLRHVQVRFRGTSLIAGRWGFDVVAELRVGDAREPISFEAVMDSSKQNFSVQQGAGPA